MTNKNLLEAEMKRRGDNGNVLAEFLEITPNTLSKKKRGRAEFTQSEIMKMKERYSLSASSLDEIFFGKELS